MKNKGFTLLEITVVIAIIIFLSTIFVVNYRGGEKQFALKRSAHKLAQDLRGAQEMALAGQEFKGIFQGGYGIYFTVTPETEKTGEYTLFVDCDDDELFDSGLTCDDCTGASCFLGAASEEVEIISLEGGIYISEFSSELFPLFEDPLSITFFPPDPTVTINVNGSPGGDFASITLTFDDQSTKTVYVNKAGLIEVK